MRWCRDCGGYIEFRDVNGQARDLPACCCADDLEPNLTPDQVRAGFCQLTSCTVCGAPVFFIRHSEGRTWFDDLVWPWPKHKCFNGPLHAVLEQMDPGGWPLLGIVLSSSDGVTPDGAKALIRLQDGREMSFRIHGSLSPAKLVQTLVVIDGESMSVVYPASLTETLAYASEDGDNRVVQFGNHPLAGARQTTRRGVPVIACEFCPETFATEQEKGAHLRNHRDWPCPYCTYATLLRDELDAHIKTCHPARTSVPAIPHEAS